ncbi:hypothetical protein BCD67_02200 [Oscillatoriales cyanobacterium USR001]|nr:hypothetical protein BCD67_02200 [Oscillatoriales cyanobacterium USR001]
MTVGQTATASTVGIAQAEIEQIEKFYILRKRLDVLQFLDNHPFLVPVLLEAPDNISDYFPGDPLFLEVVIDPESTSPDDDTMFIIIASDVDPDDSIDRLWQLDENWWLKASMPLQNKLEINVE